MESEDDILNIEFDPTELEDIDEELVLGTSKGPVNSVKQSDSNFKTQSLPPILKESEEKIIAQSSNQVHQDEESVPSDDDEEEQEEESDKDRSKFHSERSTNPSISNQRNGLERSAIPDNLDKVKLNQKDAQLASNIRIRKRYDGRSVRFDSPPERKRVFLNPQFRGTVPVNPQMRLAWDIQAQQQQRFALVNNRPMIPVTPSVVRQPHFLQPQVHFLTGAPLRPTINTLMPTVRPVSSAMPTSIFNINSLRPPISSGPSISLTSMSTASYRYPQVPQPPPMVSQWNATPYSRPPTLPASRAPTPYGTVTPGFLPTQPNAGPQTGVSYMIQQPRPVPPSNLSNMPIIKKATKDEDWFNQTEAFLRQNRSAVSGPPRRNIVNEVQQTLPKANVSRQRQAAADVKRKYRSQTEKQKCQTPVRQCTDTELMAPPSDPKGGRNVVEDVDANYLKQLEEQKKKREAILKNKEQRRLLMAKTRQEHQPSLDTSSDRVVTNDSGFSPKKRADISSSKSSISNDIFGRHRI